MAKHSHKHSERESERARNKVRYRPDEAIKTREASSSSRNNEEMGRK